MADYRRSRSVRGRNRSPRCTRVCRRNQRAWGQPEPRRYLALGVPIVEWTRRSCRTRQRHSPGPMSIRRCRIHSPRALAQAPAYHTHSDILPLVGKVRNRRSDRPVQPCSRSARFRHSRRRPHKAVEAGWRCTLRSRLWSPPRMRRRRTLMHRPGMVGKNMVRDIGKSLRQHNCCRLYRYP